METEDFKEGWLTCQDIMDRSGYSHSTVLKFIKDGVIKSTKHYKSGIPGPYGFIYLVKEEDYEEWIKSWPESNERKRGRPRKPQENKKPSSLVRVIRCKDCKHYTGYECIRTKISNIRVITEENDYCSRAERKE